LDQHLSRTSSGFDDNMRNKFVIIIVNRITEDKINAGLGIFVRIVRESW